MFYPVGSFYWSTQSTSPATLFGGTWTQVKDKFVYAASSNSLQIGGANSVTSSSTTITVAQIPAHNHSFSGIAHSHNIVGAEYSIVKCKNNLGLAVFTTIKNGTGTSYEHIPRFTDADKATSGDRFGEALLRDTKTTTAGGTIGNTGSSQGHTHTVSTMPPYVTAFCWYRIA